MRTTPATQSNYSLKIKALIKKSKKKHSFRSKITGDHVERIAFEFCQLKNSLKICSGDKNPSQNNEIDKLSQVLEKKMQELFLNCLNLKEDFTSLSETKVDLANPDTQQQLKHVLKSYALLSKQREVELLFTNSVVKPYMNMVI